MRRTALETAERLTHRHGKAKAIQAALDHYFANAGRSPFSEAFWRAVSRELGVTNLAHLFSCGHYENAGKEVPRYFDHVCCDCHTSRPAH